jgi:hypothetical protein
MSVVTLAMPACNNSELAVCDSCLDLLRFTPVTFEHVHEPLESKAAQGRLVIEV